MFNAAERKHVRLAEKEAKQTERQRREIVTGIMSLPAGRAWMLERLEQAHIFSSSFNGNALHMAFAEGERNVGLQLLNDIMFACPDYYITMMRERNERDAIRDTAHRNVKPGDDPADSAAGDDDPAEN